MKVRISTIVAAVVTASALALAVPASAQVRSGFTLSFGTGGYDGYGYDDYDSYPATSYYSYGYPQYQSYYYAQPN